MADGGAGAKTPASQDEEFLAEMKERFEHRPDTVNVPDLGGPPLTWAAKRGHVKSRRYLLDLM